MSMAPPSAFHTRLFRRSTFVSTPCPSMSTPPPYAASHPPVLSLNALLVMVEVVPVMPLESSSYPAPSPHAEFPLIVTASSEAEPSFSMPPPSSSAATLLSTVVWLSVMPRVVPSPALLKMPPPWFP